MKSVLATVAALLCSAAISAAAQPAPALTPGHLSTNIVPTQYVITVTPDPQHLTLSGAVAITIHVTQPTHDVVLNALDLTFDHVDIDGDPAAPQVAFDAPTQTAHLSFSQQIAVGDHVINIAYHGHIYRAAQGMFAVDYDANGGQERALYTQFEASDARRFVPSFDEPLLKAVFQINVDAPENRMVVSNMPVASTDRLPGGVRRVHFQPTPRMSSYLMFVGVGDFERIHQVVDGVDVGVIVKRGDAESGRFALQSAAQILPYYNDYFGTRFPLPKLDLIAGPGGGGFGAMENWGAIFYFERALLINPAVSSERDRQGVFGVIAHEMAHQWFGDLVTMAWWDDIWLNEGFATWMASHAEEHFHPEWDAWLRAQNGRQGAMVQDARATSHPIVQRIDTVDQANEAFDNITYRKGAAVIRMIETYVGADNFRAGVRAYMIAHNHSNARTADLWDAIEHASSIPMRQIADEFTHQPGVPLIRIEPGQCRNGTRVITLRQGRFGLDQASRVPELWHVPVAARILTSEAVVSGVTNDAGVARLTLQGCGPYLVNPNQTSYYRVSYPRPALEQLAQSFAQLNAMDQYGLLADSRAIGETELGAYSDVFELARHTPVTADPVVWETIADYLTGTATLYRGRLNADRYDAFARSLLRAVFQRVSWDRQASEGDNVAVLREHLILALGGMGDADIISEARRRFGGDDLPGAIREAVLNVVGVAEDAATFDNLLQRGQSTTSTVGKTMYYIALSQADDATQAQRALDHAFDPDLTASLGPRMIQTVALRHPDLAWRFAQSHQAELAARLDPLQRVQFMPSLVGAANDPASLVALRSYIDTSVPHDVRRNPEQAYLALQQRLQVRANKLSQLDEWLRAQGR